MKVYTEHFNQIVNAIAKGVVDGFGLGDFKMESETQKEEIDMSTEELNALIDQRIKKYFDDLAKISKVTWSKEAIDFVKDKEIMNGDPDGNFRPKDYVTREELAQTVMNTFNVQNK